MASRRIISSTANVLMINPGLDKSPKSRSTWASRDWLPREVGVTTENGNLMCSEGDHLRPFRNYRGTAIYELVGLVVDVKSAERQKHHLISFIDVAVSREEPQQQSQWQLFNDFMVGPVSQREAVNFEAPWKAPVLLAYQRVEGRHNIDHTWKKHLHISSLYYNGSMNYSPHLSGIPLKPNIEIPLPGTHVAIDAEFVVLQRETFDITADGERKTTRPVRQGLGRLSCLRGDSANGVDEGTAFIDDYVTIHEPIVDYVTQFSGIEPGDLDPARSQKAPISLKLAYKKLWLLLNLGCVFVGHGLTSDFRHANMFVPDAQSVDTSLLFKKGERTLKLSLLADFFLKEDIQTGNHDSIEDARTALRLWRRYQEFEAGGVVRERVEEVYRYGRKHQYMPAREYGASGSSRSTGTGTTATTYGTSSGRGGGGSSADLGLLGGRMTPEIGGGSSVGGSGPVTPQGRGRGRERDGEGVGYFESPLR
ncbi:poly(A)-specific ribonuclease [Lecanora helva]